MTVYDIKNGFSGNIEIKEKTIVALGNFDGCHTGHLSVINSALYLAKRQGAKTLVYTFDTLTKEESIGRAILTLSEKIKKISAMGVDYIVTDEFENIKNLDGLSFVSDILIKKLKCIGVSCGFNYRFGKNASYDAFDLKEIFEKIGGCVNICEKISIGEDVLSSSMLRKYIESGEIEKMIDFADPYSVYAKVEHGKMLGRTIGIPTANQYIPKEKVIPRHGVYITECEIGEDVFPSITNVGVHPTVDKEKNENIETYIIGFDKDIYCSYIRVNFYKFLREEKKFPSVDALKNQIEEDISKAKKYFCIK